MLAADQGAFETQVFRIPGSSTLNTILFDAGGVLVWPNWTRVVETLGRHGVAADAAKLALVEPHARNALDRAAVVGSSTDRGRAADYFDLVLSNAGVMLSERTAGALAEVHEYHRILNLWEHVPDFVVPTLKALRAQKYRLAVVSNANGTVRSAFNRLGLEEFFEFIVDSAEEGLEKPDPRLFELALRRVGATAREAVFVGDMYHVDIVGARAAGMSAILVDEADLKTLMDCRRIRTVADLPTMMAQCFQRP